MTSMKPLPAIHILSQAMETASVTPTDLADRLGISIQLVSDWLDGRIECDILQLSRALDVCDQSPRQVGLAVCSLLDVRLRAA